MEKIRHGKHTKDKSKRTCKKRKTREENGNSPHNATINTFKPLVEYSDVSSEDLSGPEAGEIQSEAESCVSFSDEGELTSHNITNKTNRRSHYPPRGIVEDDYYIGRTISPNRRSHRLDPSMIPRTPSPKLPRRERKHSVSSRSSRSSDIRRRKIETSPPQDFRQVISSPTFTAEYDSSERKKKRKREKKHKKDKKYKKKKKKSKHRSRSTSADSLDEKSPLSPSSRKRDISTVDGEILSDWEAPDNAGLNRGDIKLDTDACSPVSNDSHIASPEIEDKIKTPSPKATRKGSIDSPHTPPLCHRKESEESQNADAYEQKSSSPIRSAVDGSTRERSTSNVSLSPVKSSPFRNPSPESLEVSYAHRSSMSPSRKRKIIDKEPFPRRHRKDRVNRKRLSRSRSPARSRISRSPTTNWRRYSRSPSRTRINKFRSRSPKNTRDRERSPRTPPR